MGSTLQAPNIHRVRMGEYDAAVMMQNANNKREASRVALDEFTRTLRNTIAEEAAGKEFNAAQSNLAMELEATTTNRANSSLAGAEKIGALLAGAGAAGVGGSSVELLTETVKLQRNIDQDLSRLGTERLGKQGARANSELMQQGYGQRDLTRSFGSFDYMKHMKPKPLGQRWLKAAGIAVASFYGFGAEATADMEAEWAIQNGDMSAFSKYGKGGIQAAIDGLETWVKGRGNKDGETPTDWAADVNADKINWGQDDDEMFGADFGEGWTDSMYSTKRYGG